MEIPRLSHLALLSVCWNITRHVRRCVNGSDAVKYHYKIFRKVFSNEALEIIMKLYAQRRLMLYTIDFLIQCLDFIYNPFVHKAYVRPGSIFTKEILRAIAKNCKQLVYFEATYMVIDEELFVPFFERMTELVTLNLFACRFLDWSAVGAIGQCLTNLQVLNLTATNMDDRRIFALCAHPIPDQSNRAFTCCRTAQHEGNSSLRLLELRLEGTLVTNLGILCILTSIPTIKLLLPSESPQYSVPFVIAAIHKSRVDFGHNPLQLEIRRLDCLQIVDNWDGLFLMCPKVEALSFLITDDEHRCNENRDAALARHDFSNLKSIVLVCNHSRLLFSGTLNVFWEKVGKRIRFLQVIPVGSEPVSVDPLLFRNIANVFPSLEHLRLPQMFLPCSVVNFFELKNLNSIDLGIFFDSSAELIERAFRIILETGKTIEHLGVGIPEDKEAILNLLLQHKQSFPNLRTLLIRTPECVAYYRNTSHGFIYIP